MKKNILVIISILILLGGFLGYSFLKEKSFAQIFPSTTSTTTTQTVATPIPTPTPTPIPIPTSTPMLTTFTNTGYCCYSSMSGERRCEDGLTKPECDSLRGTLYSTQEECNMACGILTTPTPWCAMVGEFCEFDTHCCAGLACNTTTNTCCIQDNPFSTECSNDSECCNGKCNLQASGGGVKHCCGSLGDDCSEGGVNGVCCVGYQCKDSKCCKLNTIVCSEDSECCIGGCTEIEPGVKICCKPTGSDCAVSYECCLGHSCNPDTNMCCKNNGQGCSDGNECCNGVCTDGHCCHLPGENCPDYPYLCCGGIPCTNGKCCRSDGDDHLCSNDIECCGGNCTEVNSGVFKCCQPLGSDCNDSNKVCCQEGSQDLQCGSNNKCCKRSSAVCSDSSECCGKSCIGGKCCQPLGGDCDDIYKKCCGTIPCTNNKCCIGNGGICSDNNECCDGECIGSRCCLLTGSTCVSSSDCCSTYCVGNKCCKSNGVTCSGATECCSGICEGGQCIAQNPCNSTPSPCAPESSRPYCCFIPPFTVYCAASTPCPTAFPNPSPTCGNNRCEGTEECDGLDLCYGTDHQCMTSCDSQCNCVSPTPIPSATPELTAPPMPSATPEPTATTDTIGTTDATRVAGTPEPLGTPSATPTETPIATPTPTPTPTPSPSPTDEDPCSVLPPNICTAFGCDEGRKTCQFIQYNNNFKCCCPGSIDCPAPTPTPWCIMAGEFCEFDSECCEGLKCNTTTNLCCINDIFTQCSNNNECCNGKCTVNPPGGSEKYCCYTLGDDCPGGEGNGGCCAGFSCEDGMCCRMDMLNCSEDNDCCNKKCTEGYCCKLNGSTCTDTDCCSRACDPSTKKCCTLVVVGCSDDDECCGGKCIEVGVGFKKCCRDLAQECGGNFFCCQGLLCDPTTSKCVTTLCGNGNLDLGEQCDPPTPAEEIYSEACNALYPEDPRVNYYRCNNYCKCQRVIFGSNPIMGQTSISNSNAIKRNYSSCFGITDALKF